MQRVLRPRAGRGTIAEEAQRLRAARLGAALPVRRRAARPARPAEEDEAPVEPVEDVEEVVRQGRRDRRNVFE